MGLLEGEGKRGGKFGKLWSWKSTLSPAVSVAHRHPCFHAVQRPPLSFLHSPTTQMLLMQVRTLLDIPIDCVLLSIASLTCKPSTEYRQAGSQIRTGFKKGMFATGKKKFGRESFT